MSILETPRGTKPQEESYKLRLELKEWEKSFAAAHSGRKAGRDDIKQHPDIAQKYKQYNKLRAVLSNSVRSPESTKRNAPPAQSLPLGIPSPKRQRISQPVHPATIDQYDSPCSIYRTPIHHRICVGPTPQKDGRVLGLFDLLSPASGSLKTRSKRNALGVVNLNSFATPTKGPFASEDGTVKGRYGTGKKPSKSPTSASKRTYLDSFLTPSARRVADQHTPGSRSVISKIRYDETPSFLRRDSQGAWTGRQANNEIHEANEASSWSPVAVRRRPKLAGRGLSALVKGLRDIEDEKLDEEMDMLRELEAGDDTVGVPSAMSKPPPVVVVEDSQVLDMPLGPDGAGASDDDDDEYQNEGKGRDGRPLKVWKKRGQKRTTRKTNIKPNNAKWKPEPDWKGAKDGDSPVDELTLVAETQVEGATEKSAEHAEESDSMEYLEEDPWSEVEDSKLVSAKPKANDGRPKSKLEAAPKKTKVSATAHANFRALKIKNKQSKGKRGGRFGRGRR